MIPALYCKEFLWRQARRYLRLADYREELQGHDMCKHDTNFVNKISLLQAPRSYNHFRCSLGPIFRVYLLFCPTDINVIWQEGAIFPAVTDVDSVQSLVSNFQFGSFRTIVQSKTVHQRTQVLTLHVYLGGVEKRS